MYPLPAPATQVSPPQIMQQMRTPLLLAKTRIAAHGRGDRETGLIFPEGDAWNRFGHVFVQPAYAEESVPVCQCPGNAGAVYAGSDLLSQVGSPLGGVIVGLV